MLVIINGWPAVGKTTIAEALQPFLCPGNDMAIIDQRELTGLGPDASHLRHFTAQDQRIRSRCLLVPLLARLEVQNLILTTFLAELPDDIACLREILDEVLRLHQHCLFINLRATWSSLKARFCADPERAKSLVASKVTNITQLWCIFHSLKLCIPAHALSEADPVSACQLDVDCSEEEAIDKVLRTLRHVWNHHFNMQGRLLFMAPSSTQRA